MCWLAFGGLWLEVLARTRAGAAVFAPLQGSPTLFQGSFDPKDLLF